MILVTGGTSGIGAAVVRRFAAAGAQVLFCGRRAEPGAALERELPNTRFRTCDVADEGQVEALVAEAVAWGGPLEAAVNAAGISPRRAALVDSTVEAYEEVFRINVRGTFLCMKHQMRAMAERGGVIVNLSSVLGVRAVDLRHSLYTASKHAVIGLTKTAALEGAPAGIRVNVVCPGVIDTPIHQTNAPGAEAKAALTALHPLNRLGTPEEVAAAVAWLCSPESGFVTGSVVTVDGGASL